MAMVSASACSGADLSPCPAPTFVDPILTISSVRNTQTNDALPSVTLKDLRIGTVRITTANDIVLAGAPARNAVAEGSTIVCTLACGFGAAEGTYGFTLSRPGFVDTTVSAVAGYRSEEQNANGCPTRLANGTSVSFTMSPQEKN